MHANKPQVGGHTAGHPCSRGRGSKPVGLVFTGEALQGCARKLKAIVVYAIACLTPKSSEPLAKDSACASNVCANGSSKSKDSPCAKAWAEKRWESMIVSIIATISTNTIWRAMDSRSRLFLHMLCAWFREGAAHQRCLHEVWAEKGWESMIISIIATISQNTIWRPMDS